MKLISNGCSYTKGVELQNEINSYPNHVKENLKFDNLINLAIGGSSNERIYYETINFLSNNDCENIFVLIGWSGITRKLIWINDMIEDIQIKYVELSSEEVKKQPNFQRKKELIEFFVRYNFLENIPTMKETLEYMIGLKEYLKNKNIRYLFTLNFSLQRTDNQIIKELYSMLDYNNCFFDLSFNDFVNKNKFIRGPNNHPLEQAHLEWGKFLSLIIKSKFGEIL